MGHGRKDGIAAGRLNIGLAMATIAVTVWQTGRTRKKEQ